jgi:hypothetical protein
VGAFRQFAQANLHIQHAKRIASGAIPANRAAIVPARTPSGQIYRVRFGPLSEDQVDGACVKLKAQGLDCFPIQDENWSAAIRP